ncbi:MAG TPA: Holliday junction resolvase-like protein [Candidatus Thermoplasmatota archaeon]|nr:Holliday junction resolvase-like protein [Candidatus Thermoplasmatota archaeon]
MAGIDVVTGLSLVTIILALLLLFLVRHYRGRVEELREEVAALQSQKQSLSTTYGRITEQFAPFMAGYPYDPRNFRFIGSPVDGIQFEEDRIVFVEIKANNSRLTPAQQKWRHLVEEGRVAWLEFRAEDRAAVSTGPASSAGAAPSETQPTGSTGSAWDRS